MSVLLEARPFRPFKSSEEYLYAMKEDLAEWFQILYPHLRISVENFLDRLETGVALCEHANAVKIAANEYVQKKQARKIMTRSVTGSLAQAQLLIEIADVKYFSTAKPGTFFARDNVSNFIHWCRQSLKIIECLLFETDDLIMRKNEKHVILCLLEVARRGAKFGMLAPMLVQMERQIDREIAADQRKLGKGCLEGLESQNGDLEDETDSEMEDEQPVLMYGPLPQIVTNDLKSLDEMVRDLVEKCTCPTQFPMIRVSEGKYRIGDTKVLIFVRILRNHVMVRVGGGWDTLAHYLDKHDPCRCRSQHRATQGARLVNRPGASDLSGAQVYYDRSPPRIPHHGSYGASANASQKEFLGPPMNALNRSRSRSPSHMSYVESRRSVSPNMQRKSLAPPKSRSRSPTPNFVSTHMTKIASSRSPQKMRAVSPTCGPASLPIMSSNVSPTHLSKYPNGKHHSQHVTAIQIPLDSKLTLKSEASLQVTDPLTDHSDNASEVSDEGYRSLGLVQNERSKNRTSLYSQNSIEDADETEHQELDYDRQGDETNETGLRRTNFSYIYRENGDEPHEKPKLIREPSVEKTTCRSNSFEKAPSESGRKTSKTASPVKQFPPKMNVNNTWNGRQKHSRPAITSDTFTSPFSRNSGYRRSVSGAQYDSNGRRVSLSANTSPTKGKLKEELRKAVDNNADDVKIVEQVKKLLQKYGSLSLLDEECAQEKFDSGSLARRSPRKDSRLGDGVSRIPAPVLQKALSS